MSVLVATSDGYHIFTSSGKHLTALEGRSLGILAPGPGDSWLAIVDRREVWQHAADGTWSPLATSDTDLSSLLTVAGVVFAGTYKARLLRLVDGKLAPVESFDHIANRDEWHQVGPALNVRSMAATCDDEVVLASVHRRHPAVTDLGEVVAAPPPGRSTSTRCAPTVLPNVAMAAAAVGLCVSNDAGATWSVVVERAPTTYARAVAFLDANVLLSISDGHARQLVRRSTVVRSQAGRSSASTRARRSARGQYRHPLPGHRLRSSPRSPTGAGDVWVSETGIRGGARHRRVARCLGRWRRHERDPSLGALPRSGSASL
jgi:hypothetical protein